MPSKYLNKAVFILKMFYMEWGVEMGGKGTYVWGFQHLVEKNQKKKKKLKSKVKTECPNRSSYLTYEIVVSFLTWGYR